MDTSRVPIFESWKTPDYWQGTFAFRLRELLDPQSELAKSYPYHHRLLKGRLDAARIVPGLENISRCTHTNISGWEGQRSDGSRYQQQEDTHYMNILDPISDNVYHRAQQICSDLSDRMQIYGLAGTGCKCCFSSFVCLNLANCVQLLPLFTLHGNANMRARIKTTSCIMPSRWKNTRPCWVLRSPISQSPRWFQCHFTHSLPYTFPRKLWSCFY